MNEFIWRDEYKIGNEIIDQQHQYLFELANRIVDPNNSTSMPHNILALSRYIGEHFKAEEELMVQYQYSGYEEHAMEHKLLMSKLAELSHNIKKGEIEPVEIIGFMRLWVFEHILEKDMMVS